MSACASARPARSARGDRRHCCVCSAAADTYAGSGGSHPSAARRPRHASPGTQARAMTAWEQGSQVATEIGNLFRHKCLRGEAPHSRSAEEAGKAKGIARANAEHRKARKRKRQGAPQPTPALSRTIQLPGGRAARWPQGLANCSGTRASVVKRLPAGPPRRLTKPRPSPAPMPLGHRPGAARRDGGSPPAQASLQAE